MTYEQEIALAMSAGSNAGQIALSEYILKKYKDRIPETLKALLQKVCDQGYKETSEILGQPAEDLALTVGKLLEEHT